MTTELSNEIMTQSKTKNLHVKWPSNYLACNKINIKTKRNYFKQ